MSSTGVGWLAYVVVGRPEVGMYEQVPWLIVREDRVAWCVDGVCHLKDVVQMCRGVGLSACHEEQVNDWASEGETSLGGNASWSRQIDV